MLSYLRKKMKIILWILVIGITVPFVLWGVGGRFSQLDEQELEAGELFGETIPREEFQNSYAAVYTNAYFSKQEFDREELRRIAWDRLMMVKEAERMGIKVSDRELARTIREYFSKEGRFDQQVYENYLRLANIMPVTFERWMRESKMIERLRDMVKEMVWLSDRELKERYRDERTRYAMRYALFTAEDLEKEIEVRDKEIEEYYEQHKEEFTTPPTVDVRYALFSIGEVEAPVISEEKQREYYEEHGEDFTHEERVKARHILLKTIRPGAEKKGFWKNLVGLFTRDEAYPDEEAKEKSEEILLRLREGADFAAMAKKHSRDEETRKEGGLLGYIEREDMPRAFTNKAFKMEPGEVDGPVRTHRGYHLIKIEEKQEPGIKDFSEVREEIITTLEKEAREAAREEAKQTAYARAVDFSLTMVDTPDLDAVAEKYGVEVKETGPFAEGEEIPEIGMNRNFSTAAFQTEVGAFSDIIEIDEKGYVIIVPRAKTEQTTKSLEEAREEIIAKLRDEKAREKALETARERRGEIARLMDGEGKSFSDACETVPVETVESKTFSGRGYIPDIGYEREVLKKIKGLTLHELSGVCETQKGALFFVLTKREEPAEKEIEQGLHSYRERIMQAEEASAIGAWMSWLEERAELTDYLSTPGEMEL